MLILKVPHPPTHSKESFGRNTAPVHTCSSNHITFNDRSLPALHTFFFFRNWIESWCSFLDSFKLLKYLYFSESKKHFPKRIVFRKYLQSFLYQRQKPVHITILKYKSKKPYGIRHRKQKHATFSTAWRAAPWPPTPAPMITRL